MGVTAQYKLSSQASDTIDRLGTHQPTGKLLGQNKLGGIVRPRLSRRYQLAGTHCMACQSA